MELPECVQLAGGDDYEYPTLRNAPITEALIDIRVERSPATNLAKLESYQDPIRNRFPEKHARVSLEARIEQKEGQLQFIAPSPAEPDGFFFKSPAENLVVQCRLDGFTLSKLKPYETWKKFCGQFVELWGLYVHLMGPLRITRIALRYINRIELPPMVELKKYLLTGPEIAQGIPQGLPSFFMRLVIPNPNGLIAIVTETVGEMTPNSTTYPLIFDIDVFREVSLDVGNPEIWGIIKDLRSYKNMIFFQSLSKEAKEMFD